MLDFRARKAAFLATRKGFLPVLAILGGAVLLGVAFFIVQAQPYGGVRTWMAIDACLDHGGCWDYTHGRCEREDQKKCGHPPPGP